MKHFVPKLDATSVQISLKTCLALVLGFGAAFQLDWKPSFMGILIVVLQTSAIGATFKKGLLYILGTLGGAVAGVVMVGLFAHSRGAFIVGMAVLTGFGIYRLQGSRFAYAWLIFLVTTALVGFLTAQNTSETFGVAVMRSSTICLAVVLSFLVHGILWPIRAGAVFERQLHGFLDGCRRLVSLTSRELAGHAPDRAEVKALEAAQVRAMAALRGTLDAATGDTRRFKRFDAEYRHLLDKLRDLLLAILATRESVAGEGRAGTSPITGSDRLRAMLDAVEREMEALVGDLTLPRDGTAAPRASDAPGLPEPDRLGLTGSAFDAMIEDNVNELAAQVATVRATLARVEDPGQPLEPVPASPREPFSLRSVRFRKAASSSLVLVIICLFFILTNWPKGLGLSMIFAVLALAFGAQLPLMAIGRQLFLSLFVGAAVGAPLYFGVMPRISRYEQLIPWLCLAFLPLLYLMCSSNPRTKLVAMFGAIFGIVLLSLDETGQSYSFSTFVMMWLGLCGGFWIPLAIFGLFAPVVPEREFWKQVRAFFAGCGPTLQELEKSPPGTPAGAAIVTTFLGRCLGQLKQMQAWSSAIDYRRVPGNDRPATQALVESIERVMLCLATTAHVRGRSGDTIVEPLGEPFHRLYHTCVESFQSIATALADFEPVPDLPDTGNLFRDIESSSGDVRRSARDRDDHMSALRAMSAAAAHLRILAQAIHDSRDKANALDWEAWNRNHF